MRISLDVTSDFSQQKIDQMIKYGNMNNKSIAACIPKLTRIVMGEIRMRHVESVLMLGLLPATIVTMINGQREFYIEFATMTDQVIAEC